MEHIGAGEIFKNLVDLLPMHTLTDVGSALGFVLIFMMDGPTNMEKLQKVEDKFRVWFWVKLPLLCSFSNVHDL